MQFLPGAGLAIADNGSLAGSLQRSDNLAELVRSHLPRASSGMETAPPGAAPAGGGFELPPQDGNGPAGALALTGFSFSGGVSPAPSVIGDR